MKAKPFESFNSNYPRTSALFGIVLVNRNLEKLYDQLEAALANCRRGQKTIINKKKKKRERKLLPNNSPWWLLSAILGFNPGGKRPPAPKEPNE